MRKKTLKEKNNIPYELHESDFIDFSIKKNDLIFNIKAGDGFKKNTGLLLDQIRCVSTTRLTKIEIKGKQSKVSEETFNNIQDAIIKKIFGKKHEEIQSIKRENNKLKKEINEIKEKINPKEIEITKSYNKKIDE